RALCGVMVSGSRSGSSGMICATIGSSGVVMRGPLAARVAIDRNVAAVPVLAGQTEPVAVKRQSPFLQLVHPDRLALDLECGAVQPFPLGRKCPGGHRLAFPIQAVKSNRTAKPE